MTEEFAVPNEQLVALLADWIEKTKELAADLPRQRDRVRQTETYLGVMAIQIKHLEAELEARGLDVTR